MRRRTVEGMRLGYPCVLKFLRMAEQRRKDWRLPLEHGFLPNDVWDEVGNEWLREHSNWLEQALAHQPVIHQQNLQIPSMY